MTITTAAPANGRQNAWQTLGVAIPDDVENAADVLNHAALTGWNLRLQELNVFDPLGQPVAVPGKFGVVRDDPDSIGDVRVLGVVGRNYTLVQNEEHIAFLDELRRQSGGRFVTAGSTHGGARTFATLKLPGQIKIGGVDLVQDYLATINSHDGSIPFTLMNTPVRVACDNALNYALGKAPVAFKIQHSVSAHSRIERLAEQVLEFHFDFTDELQRVGNQLANTAMTAAQFELMIEQNFGPQDDASAATQTRFDNKSEDLLSLFHDAGTQAEIRGTAWAAVNALTEYAEHVAPTRGAGDPDRQRAKRSIFSSASKQRAVEMVLSYV